MPVPRAAPQPEEARGPADLVASMRRLQEWSGLPVSELDERLRTAGAAVPGGLAGQLDGGTLPSRDLLSAFVTTCGLRPDERERWLRVHALLAAEEAAEEDDASARHARRPSPPRHRRRRGGAPHRRISLLVAAPTIITIAVVASTLPDVLNGEHHRAAPSGTTTGRAALPGWYTFMPLTGAEPSGDCLSILPDDRLNPQLAQDRCAPDDDLQRIKVVDAPGSPETFRLQALTPAGRLWCVALDSAAERATLHLAKCGDDQLQLFGLRPAGKPGRAGQAYDIVPESTGRDGMCVGVDKRQTAGVQAVHASCDRTGIRGYILRPAPQPATA